MEVTEIYVLGGKVNCPGNIRPQLQARFATTSWVSHLTALGPWCYLCKTVQQLILWASLSQPRLCHLPANSGELLETPNYHFLTSTMEIMAVPTSRSLLQGSIYMYVYMWYICPRTSAQ